MTPTEHTWVACGDHQPDIDVHCELPAGHDTGNPHDLHTARYAEGIGVSWQSRSRVAHFTGPRAHLIAGRYGR